MEVAGRYELPKTVCACGHRSLFPVPWLKRNSLEPVQFQFKYAPAARPTFATGRCSLPLPYDLALPGYRVADCQRAKPFR